jgi:hypothetical protein
MNDKFPTNNQMDAAEAAAEADTQAVLQARGQIEAVKSWENHGSNIAGSRWFEGVPVLAVEGGRVVWKCPTQNCGGDMLATGSMWMTGDPGYHHKCATCGFTAAIKGAQFGPVDDDSN